MSKKLAIQQLAIPSPQTFNDVIVYSAAVSTNDTWVGFLNKQGPPPEPYKPLKYSPALGQY
jgi:hypothetical protein